MQRFYLDQAATSWPKRPDVLAAVTEFLHETGAAAGRGSYASARISANWIDRARIAIAKLIHAPSSDSIALMGSGTHALNEAIGGSIRPGSHVIASAIEHNSVLRPLERMRREGLIELDIVPCDQLGWVNPSDIARLKKPNTHLLAMSHASNVTGMIQELQSLGMWCRENGITFLVDAAQTIGYVPIDVQAYGIDYLAAPGHKGLGGILGTGFLYASQAKQAAHRPLMVGGTGSQSESLFPELAWPQKVEPGNLNMPGIVSMAVATEALLREPFSEREAKMHGDWSRLRDLLSRVPGLQLLAHADSQKYVGVLSCCHSQFTPTDLAAILDAEFQIEVRAGLHCAAHIHHYLETAPMGTLRFSFGHELDPLVAGALEKAVESLSQVDC